MIPLIVNMSRRIMQKIVVSLPKDTAKTFYILLRRTTNRIFSGFQTKKITEKLISKLNNVGTATKRRSAWRRTVSKFLAKFQLECWQGRLWEGSSVSSFLSVWEFSSTANGKHENGKPTGKKRMKYMKWRWNKNKNKNKNKEMKRQGSYLIFERNNDRYLLTLLRI